MNATSGRVRATRVSCPEGRWQGAHSNHVRTSKRAGTASREEARHVGAGGFRSTGQGPEPGGKDDRSVISSSLSTIVGSSSSNGHEWMSLPTSPKCTKLAPSQQQPCSCLGAARRARSCEAPAIRCPALTVARKLSASHSFLWADPGSAKLGGTPSRLGHPVGTSGKRPGSLRAAFRPGRVQGAPGAATLQGGDTAAQV